MGGFEGEVLFVLAKNLKRRHPTTDREMSDPWLPGCVVGTRVWRELQDTDTQKPASGTGGSAF